jgi:signal transduction histidine kinase
MGKGVKFTTTDKKAWLLDKLIGQRWWFIGFLGVLIFVFEFQEWREHMLLSYFIIEMTLYLIFLGGLGVLLTWQSENIKARIHTADLLERIHRLSMNLTLDNDLEKVSIRLLRFPGTVVPIISSSLWIYDPVLNHFERLAQAGLDYETRPYLRQGSDILCQQCAFSRANNLLPLDACSFFLQHSPEKRLNGYCLPLSSNDNLVGLLIFQLSGDQTLAPELVDIFNNVGLEMAIALKTAKQRQLITEENMRKAALAERHCVSQALHDDLGQTLTYLRFKLDQFTRTGNKLTIREILPDLERMRDLAAESCDVVRGNLIKLQPGTGIHLGQLLLERARMISSRAHFDISLNEYGLPLAITPQTERYIYYTVSEALVNIEKHSGASLAEINLLWGQEDLTLTIMDNGCGFDPQTVDLDNHFGLAIMRERVDALKGRIEFTASPSQGATITVWLPLAPPVDPLIAVDINNPAFTNLKELQKA